MARRKRQENAGGFSLLPKKDAKQGAKQAKQGFLVFLVAAFCIAIAAKLGAFEPYFFLQKTPALVVGCLQDQVQLFAYSKSNFVLLPLHKNAGTTSASFFGRGQADSVKIHKADENESIEALYINGQKVCEPCKYYEEYRLQKAALNELHIAVTSAASGKTEEQSSRIVFIKKSYNDRIWPNAKIEIIGSWQAIPNAQMPSSVYGEDAPAHLHRTMILPNYLAALEWPYSPYTLLSVLAPALASAILGIAPEYAYKLWQIALFFLPVAVFYLLSRKIKSGRDAVFAFSSLLYLGFPVTGLLNGGGTDLFFYGMTAHTLATSLSLLFFLFAYEHLAESKRHAFLPAVLFFALAFLSNQRIAIALAFLLGAAALPAILRKEYVKVALFSSCLFFSVLWSALDLLQVVDLEKYPPLGGISIKTDFDWIAAVFQNGYAILPLLFAAGVAYSQKNKEGMPVLLAGAALATIVVTGSASANKIAPFIDGLRFLPSFFLPAFFLSGIGAYFAWRLFLEQYEKACARHKLDKITWGGAVALAIILPLGMVYLSVATDIFDFYAKKIDSLAVAPDYFSQKEAWDMIGSERAYFIAESEATTYPVYVKNLDKAYIGMFLQPSELEEVMRSMRLRYAILGSTKRVTVDEENAHSRYDEYLVLKNDFRFSEMPTGGSSRLFELKGGQKGNLYFLQGAVLGKAEIMPDRARISGRCLQQNCSIEIYLFYPGKKECRISGKECQAGLKEGNFVAVEGISQGDFDLEVYPASPSYFLPFVLSSLLLIASYYKFS